MKVEIVLRHTDQDGNVQEDMYQVKPDVTFHVKDSVFIVLSGEVISVQRSWYNTPPKPSDYTEENSRSYTTGLFKPIERDLKA
jgi:hypothetical protein